MLGWRATGTWLLLLLGCGETTHGGELESSGGSATGGNATGGNATNGNATSGSAAGGNATGGKGDDETTKPKPLAGAGSGGAGAEAGAAGEGGVGSGPCAGIEPRCEPGEQACDPQLGKLGTCDACGVVNNVDKAGADCVRLLASDKESNAVCAVLGSDRLECFPAAFEVQKTTLPPEIIEVLLPDDYTSGSQVEPCLRDSSDRYSCSQQVCDGRVVVGDHGMCSLCHGEVSCRDLLSEPPRVEQPIDISLTDGNVFVLSPLGVHAPADAPRLPSGWRGVPAQLLVDHQLAGCAISDQREMACWLSLSEDLRPGRWKGNFKKVIASTLPRACALDDSRQLRCGNVFEDETPAPYGDADTIDFVASASIVCSLSAAGRVKCWKEPTGEPSTVAPGW
jgi:hypothetical protein